MSVLGNLVEGARSHLDVGAVVAGRHESVYLHEVRSGESLLGHQRGVVIDRHTRAHQCGVIGEGIVAEVGEAVKSRGCGLHGKGVVVIGFIALGSEARTCRVEVAQGDVVSTRETQVLHGAIGERIKLERGGGVARHLCRVEESRHVGLAGGSILPHHGGVHADVDVLFVLTKPDATALIVGGVVDDGRRVDMCHLLVKST